MQAVRPLNIYGKFRLVVILCIIKWVDVVIVDDVGCECCQVSHFQTDLSFLKRIKLKECNFHESNTYL